MEGTTRQALRRRNPRRRGAIYLATLGASMIIAVIGVAAVLAGRVQTRMAMMSRQSEVAQHAAESAVEYARLQMKNNANWRTTYSNNTWVTDIDLDEAKMTFKLVDETDGNLSNDIAQSVRLHGRGTAGTATRLLSVELAPDATGQMKIVYGTWRQEILP